MNKQKSVFQSVLDSRSDDELVQLICEGNESALDAVIGLYGGQVTAICKRICNDDLEASSVVSEVFWEFWRNASLFRSQRGSLRSYLLTIARSRALDKYRSAASHRRRQTLFVESASARGNDLVCSDLPEEQPIHDEEAKEVQLALARLPQLQQQTLALCFFDGLSHREVSERMGLPLGSVKTHIRSGLLKLKHLLATFRETREYS